MASCEPPGSRLGDCKVETLSYTRIVTARKAVADKVDELVRTGDRLVGELYGKFIAAGVLP